MKQKKIMSRLLVVWICLAALTVCGNAEGDGYDDAAITKGDAYIDKLLKDMFQDRVEEYDPYRIEDSVIGFHKKVVFVNVSGEAKLHDGYIAGLKTMHRPNHCSLEENDGRLNVKADLGAGALDFHYSGSAKFMNFGPTITVHGNLGYLEVHIEFNVDAKTGRDGKLTKFIIDDMRGMKVWITGLGPLNWAVNPIVSGATKIFKRFLRNLLESKVEKHIAEHITNFQFPVEGVDITDEPTSESTSPEPTEKLTTIEEPETVTETKEVTDEIVETESPITEVPETESPITEVPETESPITEVPETESPITEVPETESPITEVPETDEPVQPEEPETDEPVQPEEPKTDEPVQPEEPETDEPVQPEEPEIDEPVRPEEPEIDEPVQPKEPETDEPVQPEEPETDEPEKPEEPETEPVQPEESETEYQITDTPPETDDETESLEEDVNESIEL